ncbi:MAG: DUF1631 domain-containing protein [Pseudomonadales bacterium]|nr:DUF1631 domain-containing protein [Pseudomonadales bacterium]
MSVDNITSLELSSVGVSKGRSVKLPPHLEQIADKTLPELAKNFRILLDRVDDSLFQIADQAENNIDQSRYFDAMREVRIKRRGMEKRFSQNTRENFRNLLSGDIAAEEVQEQPAISFDSLSLLQNDVLEENVAFTAMSARATELVSTSLLQLNTRMNSILGSQIVHSENNPLGPEMICHAMSESIKVLDLEITSKLILLKIFEQRILNPLDKIILVANNHLIEMGVLPDFTGVAPRKNTIPRAITPASHSTSASDESDEEDKAILDLLHELIGGGSASSDADSIRSPAAGQNSEISLSSHHLLSLLSTVQKNSTDVRSNRGIAVSKGNFAIDTLAQLNDLVAQNDNVAGSIGKSDQDLIQLVSLLFDVVLDDRNLSDAMKVVIGRLQIPMIRIALTDESFFTRKNHPARRLLNEIAASTIGWSEAADQSEDPLYKKIEEVVDRVVNEFDDNVALVELVLQDFMDFTSADRQRAERVENRTREAERGRARKEHARFLVQEAINQYAVGRHLPDFVVSFLRNAWSNWMFLVLLKEGKESRQWKGVQETVKMLVWSVLPHDESKRPQLFKLLPSLLENLETGLKEISYNAAETSSFFSNLEEVHLQFGRIPSDEMIFVEGPVVEESAKTEIVEEKAAENVLVETAEIARAALENLSEEKTQVDEPVVSVAQEKITSIKPEQQVDCDLPVMKDGPESEIANSYLKKVDALEIGNWVNFSREESTPFRCKLVAILQPAGQYIFVNRNGVKVEERVRIDLAAMLHTGELEILDDGQLFDRALESVIVGLRQSNSGS